MAQAFLNPAFTALNGRVGNIVFFSYGNRTFFRSYVKPRNPDTIAQRNNRSLFRDAMKAWQLLSCFDRAAYSRRARRLGMTGHNLFISRYMRSRAHNTGSECTGKRLKQDIKTLSDTYPSLHSRGHSVYGSMKRQVIHGLRRTPFARPAAPPLWVDADGTLRQPASPSLFLRGLSDVNLEYPVALVAVRIKKLEGADHFLVRLNDE
jgi:hypothetical protein